MAWPYGRRWAALVARIPAGTLCSLKLPGCQTVAVTYDHHPTPVAEIREHRPFYDHLAFDPANLRPSCRSCNERDGQARGVARRWGKRYVPPRPARVPTTHCEYHKDCGSVHSRDW